MPMVSSMNSLFFPLSLVRWCGRLVGEDLVEDYNAFRVERRGGEGQSSPRDCKVGLGGTDCQFRELTAKYYQRGGGRGGGDHENITRPYERI